MKKINSFILKSSYFAGYCLGLPFSFIPTSIKRWLCRLAASLFSFFPRRVASVGFILVFNFIDGISRRDTTLVIDKKMAFGYRLSLDVKQKTQRMIFIHPLYESHVSNFLLKNIKSGDIFIDIGSNVGYHSFVAASALGGESDIFSFEPDPTNLMSFKKNIALNKLGGVIKVLPYAAGDKKESKYLNINPMNEGGHSFSDLSDLGSVEKELVSVVRVGEELDYLLGESSRGNIFIKIDVEGFEGSVLRGMTNFLETNNIVIICELSVEIVKTVDMMKSYGFKVFSLSDEGEIIESDQPLSFGDYVFLKEPI